MAVQSTTQQNEAVIRKLFDAFNRKDMDQVLEFVSSEFELTDIPTGMTFRGPEGMQQWLTPWVAAAPDARTEVTNIIAAGEWVFSEHTGRGTHTGPLMTSAGQVPATGRPFELQIAEVYRMKGGKLTHMRAYYDLASFMRQLGLMPSTR